MGCKTAAHALCVRGWSEAHFVSSDDTTEQNAKYPYCYCATESKVYRNDAEAAELRASVQRKLWGWVRQWKDREHHERLDDLKFFPANFIATYILYVRVGRMMNSCHAVNADRAEQCKHASAEKPRAVTYLNYGSVSLIRGGHHPVNSGLWCVCLKQPEVCTFSRNIHLNTRQGPSSWASSLSSEAKKREASDLFAASWYQESASKKISHQIISLFNSPVYPLHYEAKVRTEEVGEEDWDVGKHLLLNTKRKFSTVECAPPIEVLLGRMLWRSHRDKKAYMKLIIEALYKRSRSLTLTNWSSFSAKKEDQDDMIHYVEQNNNKKPE